MRVATFLILYKVAILTRLFVSYMNIQQLLVHGLQMSLWCVYIVGLQGKLVYKLDLPIEVVKAFQRQRSVTQLFHWLVKANCSQSLCASLQLFFFFGNFRISHVKIQSCCTGETCHYISIIDYKSLVTYR